MANYYNITAWKRTGFDYFNRPYSRDVLNSDEFLGESSYIQLDGIALDREPMEGITSIRLQGSVKDIKGTQQNDPNKTGSKGPKGPFYSWEEVDYIRITRTGYPGDVDFVDISGNQHDPWNAPHEGKKLFVAYYFVTGMRPRARNVTELYLAMDYWTTCGAADELSIESGFKIAGHITESEDATTYNLYPTNIGLLEPLEVKSTGYIEPGWSVSGNYDIIVSAADLTQYTNENEIPALVAQISTGQSTAIPQIITVQHKTNMTLQTPSEDGTLTDTLEVVDYGFFDSSNPTVQNGLSVLYSAGQLELQDSYSIPRGYLSASVTANGILNDFRNVVKETKCPVSPDITTYPRKADYLFGEIVLFSCSTGNMDIEKFYDVADNTVLTWAIPTPGGSPLARFKKIKDHKYPYDKTVSGMPWLKKAVVMQGASGSMWNQINNAFAQQTQERVVAQNDKANLVQTERFLVRGAQTAANLGLSAGKAVSSGVSLKNLFSGGSEGIENIRSTVNAAADLANLGIDIQADYYSRQFRQQSLEQAENQIDAGLAQQEMKAPYTSFIPDLNVATFRPNTFGVYVVNTSTKDRERLKNYFRRYGYDGLYKPLTWDNIRVKENVNFIKAESVILKHEYYPMRVVRNAAAVLENGVFLWNKRPDQNLFANNPDRTT